MSRNSARASPILCACPQYNFSESNGRLWGVTEQIGSGPSGIVSQPSMRMSSFKLGSERIIDISVGSVQYGKQRWRVVIPFPNYPHEMWPGNPSGNSIPDIDNAFNELRDLSKRLKSAGSVQE